MLWQYRREVSRPKSLALVATAHRVAAERYRPNFVDATTLEIEIESEIEIGSA